ncbi:hypothetical protein BC628DRAFT_840467 [Trametes gibbosa]|nr:hypothetical protein BC628DRAFT_840467 [Trametes gibbosa]
MDSCPLPIELCHLIIDFIGEEHWYNPERQTSLVHCALTCRAWQSQANRHLGFDSCLCGAVPINNFIDTIHHAPQSRIHHIHALALELEDAHGGTISNNSAPRLNELLLTTKLPNLRHLMFRYSTGSTSPLKFLHPKIVRMPPPMLTNVIDLFISRCSFPSPRSMLDLKPLPSVLPRPVSASEHVASWRRLELTSVSTTTRHALHCTIHSSMSALEAYSVIMLQP